MEESPKLCTRSQWGGNGGKCRGLWRTWTGMENPNELQQTKTKNQKRKSKTQREDRMIWGVRDSGILFYPLSYFSQVAGDMGALLGKQEWKPQKCSRRRKKKKKGPERGRRSWRKKMRLSRKKVAHLHKAREEKYTKICCNIVFLLLSFYVAEMEKLLHAFNSKVFLWARLFYI